MSPLAKISSAYGPRFAEFALRACSSRPRWTSMSPSCGNVCRRAARILAPPAPDHADLTDYALGFLDALAELDWREPVGHDYAVCRLTAISWLVHRHGLLPEQRRGD
ncbi:DUF6401 family natural product biosynthesis protein [Streptomyces sp. L7]